MAYVGNEALIGVKDGANTTFTTASPAIEVDTVLWKSTQMLAFKFVAPNTIELEAAPEASDALTASYWTSGSIIGAGSPYELPSTLDSLTFRVRTMLGEQFTEEWKNISIVDWLNEGINVICTKADFPFMESEASIDTVANQESYQLPAGFKKAIKVYYRQRNGNQLSSDPALDPSGLVYRSSPENLNSPSWFPFSGYTLFNDTFIISKPSTPLSIRIRYYRYLPYFDATNGESVSKVPRQYEDMLIDYAVMRGRQQEEIYDIAKIHEDKFNSRLDDMIIDTQRRVEDESPAIRPNPNFY